MARRNKKLKNKLAIIRRRRSLERKRVAALLGNKSTDQISRYERGISIPNLKTALKLGLIYQTPIRELLTEYFRTCREEVSLQGTGSDEVDILENWPGSSQFIDSEFCTIEERLKDDRVKKPDLDLAARHSTILIRQRAQKLGHI